MKAGRVRRPRFYRVPSWHPRIVRRAVKRFFDQLRHGQTMQTSVCATRVHYFHDPPAQHDECQEARRHDSLEMVAAEGSGADLDN